ncbi:MAG: Eco57I restriction-modification methylase domain-containing protein [bacterium]
MQTRQRDLFTTIHTEGAILPPDLLQRIAAGSNGLEGLLPESYHLLPGEKINEAINRAWSRLLGAWTAFQRHAENLPDSDIGTSLTRERWLLPLFQELGYGRLTSARAAEIEGKSYPISHAWQNTPIHLVGFRVDLDKRTAGVSGAARSSPHSLLQEFLNRAENHLWGFVTNGHKLRILRDNLSLTRQAYVEFDLHSMMAGEIYADFVLLWLLCHQSRVEAERAEDCWLEKWSRTAQEQGTRALEELRKGVKDAIAALGRGFLAHPANQMLREKLRTGALDKQDYYRQLLRLVYRLIFMFAAEDRDLLLVARDSSRAKDLSRTETYTRYYSSSRLRRLAHRQRGSRHADLFCSLRLVMQKLGSESGCPELGLPALGSFLFSPQALPDLETADLANHDLLEAIRALAYITDGHTRRAVDYKNLGAEELGSVYESLLELHPELNLAASTFELNIASGHERKTTGSYYTPTSLIKVLLDSALDPILRNATFMSPDDPEKAILQLKICDPACGSGHFLIAAAHRLARKLAAIRTGDEEPAPEALRPALRDVIGHCIYGVDLNEMAVELCKVNLWMEALEPGKPLSFLDHRIQCGNSLLGATPALLTKGIPDEAFTPVEGDDKAVCSEYKKQNKKERQGRQWELFDAEGLPWEHLGNFATAMMNLNAMADDTLAAIQAKQKAWEELVRSGSYLSNRLLADTWCAAFVWKKTKAFSYPITEEVFRQTERNPHSMPKWMREEVQRLAGQFKFFHWHLAFPDVFRIPAQSVTRDSSRATGWSGGFDVVLGNPPWERIKLQEKEWFANRRPEIANAPNAAQRRKMIEALASDDPALYNAFGEDRRAAEGESQLVRDSSRYPLTGRGDINTYAIFAELKRSLINPSGRVGCIVPSGIATDDTTKFFFQNLMDNRSLVRLYDFENRKKLFPGVDSRMKFCLLTLTGHDRPAQHGADFVFFALDTTNLQEEQRHFALTAEDIALLNPNTRTCPIFRSKRDAELTKEIYRHVPVLIKEGPPTEVIRDLSRTEENPWGIKFATMFHMSNDSHLFRTREQLEVEGWELCGNVFGKDDKKYLPLYEAKMIHHFDHRWASYDGLETYDVSYEQKNDPNFKVLPRYWVSEGLVLDRVDENWEKKWLIGFRDITNTTNERTAIFGVMSLVGVGHTCPLIFTGEIEIRDILLLILNIDSFVFDYCTRQKIGGTHLTYGFLRQLAVLSQLKYQDNVLPLPNTTLHDWVRARFLELTYTAWDLEPFAKDCGYDGPPFRWDEERRFLLRCELDAAYFHLYGITRDDVDYIMETFPIVKRKDEKKHSEYRTKRVILEIYDAMAEAMRTGEAYQTRLNPPPADPRVAHEIRS